MKQLHLKSGRNKATALKKLFCLAASVFLASGCAVEDTPSAAAETRETAEAVQVAEQNGEVQSSIEKTALPSPAETAAPSAVSAIESETASAAASDPFSLSALPPYTGNPYYVVNDNVPWFSDEELSQGTFEYYSDLDALGRCGPAYASLSKELMPSEERGSIGMVKPSGWHTVKYNGIDGNYLYNRCHLIGYQLSGENANEKNLITGTRYLNVEGMLPFENMVGDYIRETGNHVLYRVTPEFDGDNLVASGVLMEAESQEDKGASIEFCVFCYNVQPGITIDYATGDSSGPEFTGSESSDHEVQPVDQTNESTEADSDSTNGTSNDAPYIGNSNTGKFHYAWCSSVDQMSDHNKVYLYSREEAINDGYVPCKRCNP